jgi:carbon monoxide dehydrogenase subunit G
VKLDYSGQEKIPVSPDTVWAFVTDPEKVARCLPELVQVTVQDATRFDAVVRVGVGPVRGQFKLKCELQPEPSTRHMNMKIAGGGFGSAVDLTASADIADAGDGTTRLDWRGTAEMRGTVAAAGSRVLDAQAQKLVAQTFANVSETLSA